MSDSLLTVEEVAAILKVARRTVFRHFQSEPALPSVKIGGARRVWMSQLMEFIRKCQKPGENR